MTDRERLIVLNMIPELGSMRIRSLIKHFGSLKEVFSAGEEDIARVQHIGPRIASKIKEGIKERRFFGELRLIDRNHIKTLTIFDKDYPENLKDIYDPPPVLYIRGSLLPQDRISVAVVGSRRASIYGLSISDKLSFDLSLMGITVVSGLARGIDSSAHRGALKAGGRTIAVLGSGLMNIYPEEHAVLAEEISSNGAVVSEYPLHMPPLRQNFPIRNRVISGLSLGVVIVEAGGKSGALITGDFAAEQGREVFAVPGKIDSFNSRGTNRLIRQGAKLVESTEDIIEELNLSGFSKTANRVDRRNDISRELDKIERMIYNLLSDSPLHIEELHEASGLDIGRLSTVLFGLQSMGLIKQAMGESFVRS